MSIEISNLVVAVTDTTGNTLTYLFFELARNQMWQERLRTKLEPIDFHNSVPTYHSIQSLPVLDSVIWETLRMHPPVPSSLPRVSPGGGAEVSGIYMPSNTIVSSQAYTTQRLSSIFPESDSYKPGRWIETNGGTDEMKELMFVLGRARADAWGRR